MKKEIIIFKLTILISWITFLSILLFSTITVMNESIINSNKMTYVLSIIIGLYTISFMLFSIILFNINKLLNSKNIDKICTNSSINSLNIMIKYSKIMSIIHFISVPFFYIIAEVDDAPGVIIVGMVLFGFPILLLSISSFFKKIIILQNIKE